MAFDREAAAARQQSRRQRLKYIRDDFSRLLDEYWDDIPNSSEGEGELEYRISERLRSLQRDVDAFIRDFKNLPNE